jgi:hypothetical protein
MSCSALLCCLFRLHWNAVVLHIVVMCSTIRQPDTFFWTPWIPYSRTHWYRNLDDQLPRVFVREDTWLAVSDPQSAIRRWFQYDLHGLVTGHRRLLPKGSQISRFGDQHLALWISNRFVNKLNIYYIPCVLCHLATTSRIPSAIFRKQAKFGCRIANEWMRFGCRMFVSFWVRDTVLSLSIKCTGIPAWTVDDRITTGVLPLPLYSNA